jgi:hypothetical protein
VPVHHGALEFPLVEKTDRTVTVLGLAAGDDTKSAFVDAVSGTHRAHERALGQLQLLLDPRHDPQVARRVGAAQVGRRD